MKTLYTFVESPLGALLVTSDGTAVTRIYMNVDTDDAAGRADWINDATDPALVEAARQLGEYFDGARKEFDLQLAPRGTAFQHRVWSELRKIGYGETVSYGEIARRIGLPSAARAVGLANGSNPISIVVPCHRVIGANGKLTGYGGGLNNKAILLELEKRFAESGNRSPSLDLFALTQAVVE